MTRHMSHEDRPPMFKKLTDELVDTGTKAIIREEFFNRKMSLKPENIPSMIPVSKLGENEIKRSTGNNL